MTPSRPCTIPPDGASAALAASVAAAVPALSGPRVRLRAPRLEDYPAYVRLLEADTGHMGGPFGPQDIWTAFCNYVAGWMLRGLGSWAVEESGGRPIGFVGLALEWDDEEPELGWMFLPEARGRGLATDAARLARDWGLERLDACVSYVDPDNHRSSALARRLGARRDPAAETRVAARQGAPVSVWRHGARR